MFWKKSKPPKESQSTSIVRQDSRTTVTTATAQSETTSTSVQNATVFSDKTVNYRTTTQTITHQQQARVTEIVKRYTPTPEELAEMMANLTQNETSTKTTKKKPTALPAIEYKSIDNSNNIHNNKNNSPLSPLVYNYDSPRASASGNGNARYSPTAPTIAKIQKTYVTQNDGRTVTSQVQQQRIKMDARSFNLSSPNSPLTNRRLMPAAGASTTTTTTTTRLPATSLTANINTGSSGGTAYVSPYLNRSLYTPPQAPTTKLTTTKPLATSNTKSLAPSSIKPPAPPTTRTTITSTTIGPKSSTNNASLRNTWLTTPSSSAAPSTTFNSNFKSSMATPSFSSATKTNATGNNIKSSVYGSNPPYKSIYNTNKLPANKTNDNISSLPNNTPFSFSSPTQTAVAPKKRSKLKPGYAYVFNNEEFDNPNNEYRVGSSEDVKNLKKTFGKFKINVNLIENATLKEIDRLVKKLETKDFSSNSCLIIVILSHGSRHEEVCAKDGSYSIDDTILYPILRNRTLIDKPKMFFIQACKGSMEGGSFHKDAVQPHGSPNEILKCYSTFEGYVSYRTEQGSIFIENLCKSLQQNGSVKSIKDIMEDVTKTVKDVSKNKQIPAVTTTLTQPYIFGDYV